MTDHRQTSGPRIDVHLSDADIRQQLPADVREGLSTRPLTLPPKWFYDARGSELYEQITTLEEYYPFRAEREILAERADEIAKLAGSDVLVELGSGSSEKTRFLLEAMIQAGLRGYVPVDVSESALRSAADAVASEHPELVVHGVVADFTRHLDRLPADGDRTVAFLGGTVGNLEPNQRGQFLRGVRATLRTGEHLLLGADLVKSPDVLVPAYDDARGVTAEFNRNVLRVVNRELGADFMVEDFRHRAIWNAEEERIEMRLQATRPMTVTIPGAGSVEGSALRLELAQDEEIRTEVSCKFTFERLGAELEDAGFRTTARWADAEDRFSLTLATAS